MPKESFRALMVMSRVWEQIGGIERVNQSIIRFVEKENWYATILILGDAQQTVNAALIANGLSGKNITVIGCAKSKKKLILDFLKARFFRKYDLVYFGHVNLTPLRLLSWPQKEFSITLTYGIDVWGKIDIFKILGLSLCSKILTISNYTKIRATQQHNIFLRSIVCHLGANVDLSQELLYDRKPEWHKRSGKILCVGRMSAEENYKGHRELICAMAQLRLKVPDCILVLVGDGSGMNDLKQLTIDLGLEDNVCFAGYVSDKDLHGYYMTCDVFAMPSRGEGFGLVYLEAMSHGKPCIGSYMDAASEVIADGETGFLVNPENINDITERLFQLLTNEKLRRQQGEAGQRRYQEHFTEEKFHQRLRTELISINGSR